jgi:hypothetical protein
LPYTNVTFTCIQTPSNNCSGAPTSFSIAMNASFIAQATTQTNQSQNNSNFPFSPNLIPFNGQGALWFLPFLALVGLALTGLLLYRDIPFGKAINATPVAQKKWGNYALIGIGALSVLVQIVLIASLGSQIQNSPGISGSGSALNVSAGGHVGFWLYMLGMVAVAGGAIFLLVQENRSALPLSASYPPGTSLPDPYAQPNPYPTEQYPPSQNPYPAGQYPPPQNPYPTGQYPPPQNPYPAGQYPPTSYPPQPPYPPGQ